MIIKWAARRNPIAVIVIALLLLCNFFAISIYNVKIQASAENVVFSDLYTLSGGSTAEYGKHPYADTKEGLMVSLGQNDSIQFNQVLNLKDLTKYDSLIDLFLTPSNLGKERDFEKLRFVFTDIHDVENKLTITVRGYDARENPLNTWSYLLAGTTKQPLSGLEGTTIHRDSIYGKPIPFAFAGNGDVPLEDQVLSLRLDWETSGVYSWFKNQAFGENLELVIDLDSVDHFAVLWDGFTTGEVKLAIYAEELNKSTANFVITNLLGVDLSKNEIADEEPVIDIDLEGYDKFNLPDAKVGVPYELYYATAFHSLSGEYTAVDIKAYTDYDTRKQEIEIKNNAFIAPKAGEVVLEYLATNPNGSITAKQTLSIIVRDTLPEIEINFAFPDRKTSAYVGEEVAVSDYVTAGGSGRINVDCYAIGENQTVEVINNTFCPLSEGKYSVTYVASDRAGQKESFSYSVDISYSPEPVFTTAPEFLPYYIAGSEYVIPECPAYYFSESGKTSATVETFVKEMGGNEIKLGADRKYSFSTTFCSSEHITEAEIIYKSGNVTKTLKANVVNVRRTSGLFDLTRYFVAPQMELTADKGSIELAADRDTDAEFNFIRELLSEGFELRFDSSPSKNDFQSIVFYLTDSENPDDRISIKFINSGRRSLISINGSKEHEIESGFMESSTNKNFSLIFKNDRIVIGSIELPVKTYLDGRAFEGFKSNMLYLSGKFLGVGENAAINIRNINGQVMSSVGADNVVPKMNVNGSFGGSYVIDTVVYLPPAYAADVLDANITFLLNVYAPDGTIMKDNNGELLFNVNPRAGYYISLSEYGNYRVAYSFADTNNMIEESFTYIIGTVDLTAPVICISDYKTSITVTLGETIKIPNATASDNVSTQLIVKRYLVNTRGEIIAIDDSKNALFEATSLGTYRIQYYVSDEAGNVDLQELIVKVVSGEKQAEGCRGGISDITLASTLIGLLFLSFFLRRKSK